MGYVRYTEEILADNIYVLDINNFLMFALSDYIKDEIAYIDFDEALEDVRTRIFNCGKPTVGYCFNRKDFDDYIERYYSEYISKVGEKYKVDMKKLCEGWDNLNKQEKDFIGPNPHCAKIFCFMCNFFIDKRIEERIFQEFKLNFWP